jgi:hypothetical protein
MTIQERIINVTYKDTTRAISFVYNDKYSKLCSFQVTARVLYIFKDLIPDYQKYSEMIMPFDIYKDTEVSFELPALEFNFTIITIGHGTLEVKINNEYCLKVIGCRDVYIELEKQIGIAKDCIELCNEEGEEFINTMTMGKNKMTLYAVIKSFENEVLEKGYTIIDYKSEFKVGHTMRVKVYDRIGNYRIVKFSPELYIIRKRTQKTVWNQNNNQKRIQQSHFGELINDHYSGYIVSWENGIEYNKYYAIAV